MEKIGDLRRDEKFSRKTVKGFTLIELLIVIAIIGVLAAISSIVISGFVRDSTFESCNNKAHLAYTAMQNALIQAEIKQDSTAFDATDISTGTAGTSLTYACFVIVMNNGELDRSANVKVKSYYDSPTAVDATITPSTVWDYSKNSQKSGLTGATLEQAKAFKFLKNYFEKNLGADFTGTLQIFVDYENYTVDSVVFNEKLNHEITYLKTYTKGGKASVSVYGEDDIMSQRDRRKVHGEFFGCYPMMNDL